MPRFDILNTYLHVCVTDPSGINNSDSSIFFNIMLFETRKFHTHTYTQSVALHACIAYLVYVFGLVPFKFIKCPQLLFVTLIYLLLIHLQNFNIRSFFHPYVCAFEFYSLILSKREHFVLLIRKCVSYNITVFIGTIFTAKDAHLI